MPSNLVVKKNDETTDITFNAKVGAAGDKTSTVYRQDTGAPSDLPVGMRATFEVKAMDNGPKTARRVETLFKGPHAVLSTDTGTYTSRDRVLVMLTVIAPNACPAGLIEESVAQALNCNKAIKASLQAGYAPT